MISDCVLPWILDFSPLRHAVREKYWHEKENYRGREWAWVIGEKKSLRILLLSSPTSHFSVCIPGEQVWNDSQVLPRSYPRLGSSAIEHKRHQKHRPLLSHPHSLYETEEWGCLQNHLWRKAKTLACALSYLSFVFCKWQEAGGNLALCWASSQALPGTGAEMQAAKSLCSLGANPSQSAEDLWQVWHLVTG